jgi:hypothetical protein
MNKKAFSSTVLLFAALSASQCAYYMGAITGVIVKERLPKTQPKGWVEFFNWDLLKFRVYKPEAGGETLVGPQSGGRLSDRPYAMRMDSVPGPQTFILKYNPGDKPAITNVDVDVEEGMIQLVRVVSHEVSRYSSGYNRMTVIFSLSTDVLGRIPVARDAAALPKLREALKHPDWATQWYAAYALQDMAAVMDDETYRLLDSMRQGAQEKVKDAVNKAIANYRAFKARK